MAGLFSTPEQVRQEQQAQLQQQANTMFSDPIARASYMATAGIAPSIGGLFGVGSQAENEARQIQEIISQVPLDENTDPYAYYTDLARRLINSGMTQAGNEALAMAQKAGSQALDMRKKELDIRLAQSQGETKSELDSLRMQKLKSEINRLNTPDQISAKDRANLAKDFTSKSVAQYLRTGNVEDLQYRVAPEKSNYTVLSQVVGQDRNGVPITQTFLVDRNQVAELTGGAPFVGVQDLMGQDGNLNGQAATSVTEPVDLNEFSPAIQEKLEQQGATESNSLPDVPPVAGFTPNQSVEARYEGLRDVSQAETLIRDVFSPEFKEVAGVSNWVRRKAQWATDGRLAPIGARMEKGAIQRAIAAAKLLGVNPTDKDFAKTLESAPTGNDGVSVWQDWTVNSFVPELLIKMESEHGKDSQIYKATKNYLDDLIKEVRTKDSDKKEVNWADL